LLIREATEGKNFEAIIQDEFFGIQDQFSRRVYLIVSCFYQHAALLRTELLCKLTNVPAEEFYGRIEDPLKGIIFYELIDNTFKEYAVRTRHRSISAIVWNSCLSSGEHDEIIHLVLDSINISYQIDKIAFDNFIRSDQMVDSLISLESKMRFFEKACKIDPDNPYVMQHYARMLVRAKKETPALSIIENAIKMDGSIRMLHHTKGYILQQMAMAEVDIEIARRYKGLSEESYLRSLHMNEKDAYSYQGLSSLYLSWAKRVNNDQEETLYLAKAENIVEEGLKKAKDKEAIWIESSYIEEYIGDMPNRIKSLQEAVNVAPHSNLSRYLLARAYNLDGKFDKGRDLLRTVVQEYPEEYKSTMEYAKSVLFTGGDILEAIAILQQSILFGYSDSRFIATLGGLLFLNKQFTDATHVFEESTRREIYNAQKIMFHPTEYNIDNIFTATVSYVGNGYSYLSIDGYKDVKCFSSKYKGLILSRGMQLTTQIEFAPKYPIAKIRLTDTSQLPPDLDLSV
jgi:hypothetical protein